MSDIQSILELLYSLKKDILFTQKLLTRDSLEYNDKNLSIIQRALASIKEDEERIDFAYNFIKEKFPNFKFPDKFLINQKISKSLRG